MTINVFARDEFSAVFSAKTESVGHGPNTPVFRFSPAFPMFHRQKTNDRAVFLTGPIVSDVHSETKFRTKCNEEKNNNKKTPLVWFVRDKF